MSLLRTLDSERDGGAIEVELAPEADLSFPAMGTRIRLLVGAPSRAAMAPAAEMAESLRAWIEDFDRRLSRFRSDSELSRLNAHPDREFSASPLLVDLVRAGIDAAELTGGLVDPTLLEEIARAGYAASRARTEEPLLPEALAAAPARRPAEPDPRQHWRAFEIDAASGTVSRDPGIGFDSGGIGKGLAADLACEQLAGYQRFLVDCGGDIRVGGIGASLEPYRVEIAHPLDGSHHRRVRLSSGAVATSGIDGRIWREGDGFSHHILDPATGRPAWTGVISATAIAPSAVEAEALAKAALLAGPTGAGRLLARHGGLFVLDSGDCKVVRPRAATTRRAPDHRPRRRRE